MEGSNASWGSLLICATRIFQGNTKIHQCLKKLRIDLFHFVGEKEPDRVACYLSRCQPTYIMTSSLSRGKVAYMK